MDNINITNAWTVSLNQTYTSLKKIHGLAHGAIITKLAECQQH